MFCSKLLGGFLGILGKSYFFKGYIKLMNDLKNAADMMDLED